MLRFLESATSERKFWLFACACCRYATQLLPGDRAQQAIDIGERFADHLASSITRHMVREAVSGLAASAPGGPADALLCNLLAVLGRACSVGWSNERDFRSSDTCGMQRRGTIGSFSAGCCGTCAATPLPPW
jgi:hypothetical protein